MREHTISTTPVAIYIPTYNRAKCLDRTIRSALAQTHRNIRVYVSDNASSDNTEEVCRKYTVDARCSYLRLSQNQGALKNFESFNSCSGEPWMMFLADDDYIDKDYIEKCLSFALKNDCIRVGGTAVNYVGGIERFRDVPFVLKHDAPLLRLFCFSSIPNTNAVFYGVHRKTTLALDSRMPSSDVGYSWRQISRGKVAVIGTTHIHRDVTHWLDRSEGALPAVWVKLLVANGYTEFMIQDYARRYSILDQVSMYYEELNGRCEEDELRVFLYLMYCVEWCIRVGNMAVRPRFCDFIRDATRDATKSGFAGIERFHKLEEWLRRSNGIYQGQGAGSTTEVEGVITRRCGSFAGWAKTWNDLWGSAARVYDKGSQDGGLQAADIIAAQGILRSSCFGRAQLFQERLAKIPMSRYWYGAKIRSIPLIGHVWARYRASVKR
ncbi:MAG: glycosyltransferase family 2 protein [bacterium]